MVQPGARLTFVVTGNGPSGLFNMTGAQLRGVVVEGFRASGVVLKSLDYQHTDSFLNADTSWSYYATVTVETLYAHAAAADVGAIVSGVFWTAAGSAPVVTQAGVDPSQPGLPVPPLIGGLQLSLGMLAVIAVAIAIIVVKS